jgi:protein transport protein SEC20
MEVVREEGEVRVVGVGEEGAVPTVQVGRTREEAGEPDSMVEKVGRMVEDTLNRREEEEANRTAEEAEAQRNPMKRMWEEDNEAALEPERARDEL